MKTNLLKWYMFAFLLIGDYVMFAATVVPDNAGGEEQPEEPDTDVDPDSTPINGKLILLALVGVAFAFHYYKKMKQERLMQN